MNDNDELDGRFEMGDTFHNPSEEVKAEFLKKVQQSMIAELGIHLMKNGNVAMSMKMPDNFPTPKDFKEYVSLPVEDLKLVALKAELMGYLTDFRPSPKLSKILSSDTEDLKRAMKLGREDKPCDCPKCMSKAEHEKANASIN